VPRRTPHFLAAAGGPCGLRIPPDENKSHRRKISLSYMNPTGYRFAMNFFLALLASLLHRLTDRAKAALGVGALFVALTAPSAPAIADAANDLAQAVLAKTPVIDSHNDTPEQLRTLFKNDFTKFDLRALPAEVLAKTQTDIPKLRAGRVGGQFWSVWIEPSLPKDEAVVQTLEQIDTVERMVARYPETFAMARTANDIEAAIKRGKIASLIGMEGGHSIGNSLAVLRQMHRAGARYMTLTHFLTNDWADSATDTPRHDGLAPFGVAVVREMNRLGMMVDLSHVAQTTMNDVLDVTAAPVIFTHSNAAALLDHPRNVPDQVLKRLPANGGVVMVTFVPDYTNPAIRDWESSKTAEVARWKAKFIGNPKREKAAMDAWLAANPRPRATLKQVADHIDHIRTVAGIDHIGIGGDFGGIESVVEGLENVSTYPSLFAELARRGYSRTDLAKIAQGNVLRVMRANERVAAAKLGEPPSDVQFAAGKP
jgi:membrane dipeptidase